MLISRQALNSGKKPTSLLNTNLKIKYDLLNFTMGRVNRKYFERSNRETKKVTLFSFN